MISRARSGRKLKKITVSLSLIVATGLPFSVIAVGTKNSSVTSFAYRKPSIAATALSAVSPSPFGQLICLLHTIPAVITVHCIIASGNSSISPMPDSFILASSAYDKLFTGIRTVYHDHQGSSVRIRFSSPSLFAISSSP